MFCPYYFPLVKLDIHLHLCTHLTANKIAVHQYKQKQNNPVYKAWPKYKHYELNKHSLALNKPEQ